MRTYRVTLTFTEELLGAVAKNRDVYKDFIQKKAREAGVPESQLDEEIVSVSDLEQVGWTGFHTLPDGRPGILNYVIKGFFKDACSMLRREPGSLSAKLSAHKKVIDGLIFVSPRLIPLVLPEGGAVGVLERPLRAATAQGERVALARSDTVPAGTTMTFTLTVMGEVTDELLNSWFSYGQFRGLGQWRSSGTGSFSAAMTQVVP